MKNYLNFLSLSMFIYFNFPPIMGNSDILKTMSNNDYSEFSNIMVEIFKTCKEEHSSLLYYLENASEYNLNNSLWSFLFSSAVYFNETSMINTEKKLYESKIDAFILIAHSIDNLEQVLLNFGSISWWDIMTPFYILDESNTNCTGVFKIFRMINSIGLLKAYSICKNNEEQYLVFTFNPFTDHAPQSWEKYENEDLSPANLNCWVLYSRPYKKGTLCDEFDYDRTRNLDEYTVVAGKPIMGDSDIPMFTYTADTLRKEFMEEKLNIVFETITRVFPQTTHEKNHSELFDEFYKLHEDKILGINFIPTLVNYVDRWYFQNTFPVSWTNFGILTHTKGFKTPIEKIKDFYGVWSLISMILILSLTALIIWFSTKNNRGASAVFDILRLLVNASVVARMDKLSLKVFFSMVFLYFLIIHATFSGHLVEFLTKPELRKLPQSLDDLKNPIYKQISVTGLGSSLLIDPALIDKTVHVINQYDCANSVTHNASVVCIDNYDFLFKDTILFKLHINQRPFSLRYYTHLIRKHWNLNQRINQFYMNMMESGLSNIFTKQEDDGFLISLKMDHAKHDDYIRPLDLNSLDFAFIILGFGLSVGTISFIIEYFYFRYEQLVAQKNIII